MAKFDFIEAAASGYRYVWQERQNILPFAAIPFFVKIGCYALVALLGLEHNFLRQGLVLMPGYFLEGFLVALVIRMAIFSENYNDLLEMGQARGPAPEYISRPIMACVVIYSLTKLLSAFLAGIVMNAQEINEMPVMPEPTQSPIVMMIMILIFVVWAFRFFWLYVPAAMDIKIPEFLEVIKPFMVSVYMLGFWMMCSVPFLILLTALTKMLGMASPGAATSVFGLIVMGVGHSVIELMIALVSSVGMAHAVQHMMSNNKKPPRKF